MTSFHAVKCCHLVSAHAASARRICSSVHQFLVHSTFIHVVCYSQAIDRARDMVDTELTALAAESYSRAYGVSLSVLFTVTLTTVTVMVGFAVIFLNHYKYFVDYFIILYV